ncbi:MAG: TonB-dependent receptor plug domain-containing protein [Bacteroidales bacterium]|nr:TonB-dependent receptor plug domain-containing protein [Bacteroidales bacterium]
MKKLVCIPAALTLTGLLLCTPALAAGTPAVGTPTTPASEAADSTDVIALQEAVIGAVRAPKDAPFAVANISKKELADFSRSGRELPFLFARTPGVTAWSENGTGIGTSYLRIRGAGGSRINVTLDGVPLNSPEDQCVFWANMNSYSQLLGSVQIQRGIGSSTNGDGAFGGSIALGTANPSLIPSATVSGAYGAFNSYTAGIKLSSGLLWNHLILEGAFHQSGTDGFMHGTKGTAGSYYAALTYLGKNVKIGYKLLGNYENTGQAWNGVTAGNDDLSLMDGCGCDPSWGYDQSTGIRTYADLCQVGLGQFNSLYERLDTDGNGLFYKDANGNYVTKRYTMSDGSLWPRTTDNFWQNHHILSGAWTPSEALKLSATLHYTGGKGWYEEFRYNNKLLKYGIPWTPDGQGGTIKKADFVRRKGLTQDHFGGLLNLLWKKGAWELTAGIAVQYFKGYHYAFLSYCSNAEVLRQHFDADGRHSYYNSNADKLDGDIFLKALWHLSPAWSLFADLQYRDVRYRTTGGNDKYIDNGDGTSTQQQLDVNVAHHFFNPKTGVNFSQDGHRAYASFAYSSREPERNNYTDNGSYPFPRPECLYDTEAGYQYKGDNWDAGINLYYMYFKDQLVQTGEVSDIGEALTTNIPRSYRTGAELTAGWDITSWLRIEGNAALSANRLLDFDEVVEDWDNGYQRFHYTDKTLAFSPTAILNGFIDIHYKGISLTWHTSYVSRQYLDNSENLERSLPGYSLSEFGLSYTMKFPRIVRELRFGVDVSNVFNARVAQSGWVYSAIAESLGHSNANRYYQIGFIPVAPCGALASVRVTF